VRSVADAIQLKTPAKTPAYPFNGSFPAYYAGITPKEVMYNYDKAGSAWEKYLQDFQPDLSFSSSVKRGENVQKLLITAIAKINEEKTPYLVRQALEKGIDPFTILDDVRRGLEIIVEMYSQGKYFLADLVMAAEIYKEAQQIVLGPPQEEGSPGSFQIVFGTVKKDIHDIGKNITIATMRQFGLSVLDLGVDVSPQHCERVRKVCQPLRGREDRAYF